MDNNNKDIIIENAIMDNTQSQQDVDQPVAEVVTPQGHLQEDSEDDSASQEQWSQVQNLESESQASPQEVSQETWEQAAFRLTYFPQAKRGNAMMSQPNPYKQKRLSSSQVYQDTNQYGSQYIPTMPSRNQSQQQLRMEMYNQNYQQPNTHQLSMGTSEKNYSQHESNIMSFLVAGQGGLAVPEVMGRTPLLCSRLLTTKLTIPFTSVTSPGALKQVIVRASPTSSGTLVVVYGKVGSQIGVWQVLNLPTEFQNYDQFNITNGSITLTTTGYSSSSANLSGIIDAAIYATNPGDLANFNFTTAAGCQWQPLTGSPLVNGCFANVFGGTSEYQQEAMSVTKKYELVQTFACSATAAAGTIIFTAQKCGQVRLNQLMQSSTAPIFSVFRPTYTPSTGAITNISLGTLNAYIGTSPGFTMPLSPIDVLPGDIVTNDIVLAFSQTPVFEFRSSDESGENHCLFIAAIESAGNQTDVVVELNLNVAFTPYPSTYQNLGRLNQAPIIPYYDGLLAIALNWKLNSFGLNPVMQLDDVKDYSRKLREIIRDPELMQHASAGMFQSLARILSRYMPIAKQIWEVAKPGLITVGQQVATDLVEKGYRQVEDMFTDKSGQRKGGSAQLALTPSQTSGTYKGSAAMRSNLVKRRVSYADQDYTPVRRINQPAIGSATLQVGFSNYVKDLQVDFKSQYKASAMMAAKPQSKPPNLRMKQKAQKQDIVVVQQEDEDQEMAQTRQFHPYDLQTVDTWCVEGQMKVPQDHMLKPYIGAFPVIVQNNDNEIVSVQIAHILIQVGAPQDSLSLLTNCTHRVYSYTQREDQQMDDVYRFKEPITYVHEGVTINFHFHKAFLSNAAPPLNFIVESFGYGIALMASDGQSLDITIDALQPATQNDYIPFGDYSYFVHLLNWASGIRSFIYASGCFDYENKAMAAQGMASTIIANKLEATYPIGEVVGLVENQFKLVLYVSQVIPSSDDEDVETFFYDQGVFSPIDVLYYMANQMDGPSGSRALWVDEYAGIFQVVVRNNVNAFQSHSSDVVQLQKEVQALKQELARISVKEKNLSQEHLATAAPQISQSAFTEQWSKALATKKVQAYKKYSHFWQMLESIGRATGPAQQGVIPQLGLAFTIAGEMFKSINDRYPDWSHQNNLNTETLKALHLQSLSQAYDSVNRLFTAPSTILGVLPKLFMLKHMDTYHNAITVKRSSDGVETITSQDGTVADRVKWWLADGDQPQEMVRSQSIPRYLSILCSLQASQGHALFKMGIPNSTQVIEYKAPFTYAQYLSSLGLCNNYIIAATKTVKGVDAPSTDMIRSVIKSMELVVPGPSEDGQNGVALLANNNQSKNYLQEVKKTFDLIKEDKTVTSFNFLVKIVDPTQEDVNKKLLAEIEDYKKKLQMLSSAPPKQKKTQVSRRGSVQADDDTINDTSQILPRQSIYNTVGMPYDDDE